MVRLRHILFKHGGGKVSGEYLLKKEDLWNWDMINMINRGQ